MVKRKAGAEHFELEGIGAFEIIKHSRSLILSSLLYQEKYLTVWRESNVIVPCSREDEQLCRLD